MVETRDKRPQQNEDEVWVREFREGRQEAYDELVLKYQDRVFNLCFRLMGDYDDADDAAQEVFIRVYRALTGFRGEASFYTWIYRIAVNTCKNKLTSLPFRLRRRVLRLGQGREAVPGEVLDLADEKETPAARLERRENMKLMEEAIAALPPEQRTLVVLRDVEGLSYQEIVRITGENPGTVKSKLARGRDKIKDILRGRI